MSEHKDMEAWRYTEAEEKLRKKRIRFSINRQKGAYIQWVAPKVMKK